MADQQGKRQVLEQLIALGRANPTNQNIFNAYQQALVDYYTPQEDESVSRKKLVENAMVQNLMGKYQQGDTNAFNALQDYVKGGYDAIAGQTPKQVSLDDPRLDQTTRDTLIANKIQLAKNKMNETNDPTEYLALTQQYGGNVKIDDKGQVNYSSDQGDNNIISSLYGLNDSIPTEIGGMIFGDEYKKNRQAQTKAQKNALNKSYKENGIFGLPKAVFDYIGGK